MQWRIIERRTCYHSVEILDTRILFTCLTPLTVLFEKKKITNYRFRLIETLENKSWCIFQPYRSSLLITTWLWPCKNHTWTYALVTLCVYVHAHERHIKETVAMERYLSLKNEYPSHSCGASESPQTAKNAHTHTLKRAHTHTQVYFVIYISNWANLAHLKRQICPWALFYIQNLLSSPPM